MGTDKWFRSKWIAPKLPMVRVKSTTRYFAACLTPSLLLVPHTISDSVEPHCLRPFASEARRWAAQDVEGGERGGGGEKGSWGKMRYAIGRYSGPGLTSNAPPPPALYS